MDIKDRLLLFINYKKISVARFEKVSGLSNGYVKNFKGNFSAPKLEGVLRAFPDLSRTWLLSGDGDMIVNNSACPSTLEHSQQANGNGNVVTQTMQSSAALEMALGEISEMRKLVQEQVRINQEQASRLLSVIEKLTDK